LQSFSSATGGLPITVTTLSDTPTTGFCTLREAILNVNDPGIDHTEGDCAIDTGLHTIEFSLSGTITLGSTLPAITRTAIFDGTGQNIIVSGGNAVRVGSVTFTGRLTLMDITIANGKDIDFGGGFYNVGGTLNVTSSTFTNNTAAQIGGGIYSVYTTETNPTVTITNSTFSGNSATGPSGNGGAVGSFGSTLTISNSTFSDNSAGRGAGGGISQVAGGTLTISNSTFSG